MLTYSYPGIDGPVPASLACQIGPRTALQGRRADGKLLRCSDLEKQSGNRKCAENEPISGGLLLIFEEKILKIGNIDSPSGHQGIPSQRPKSLEPISFLRKTKPNGKA
jgi:hypothetical protein